MSYLTPEDILNKVASFQSYESVKVRGEIIENDSGFLKLCYNGYKVDLIWNGPSPPSGILVDVEGIVKCYAHPNGGVYPKIEVRSFSVVNDENHLKEFEYSNREKELLEIVRKKSSGVKKLHSTVLKLLLSGKDRIRVSVIHGTGAQTHKDFLQGLSESFHAHDNFVDIRFIETSLISDKELSECIKRASSNSDLIFIVRGGGKTEELQSIGGINTCKAIAECTKPVYVALGHSLDRNVSMIEKVSDEHFATPSLAGVELGRALNQGFTLLDYEEKKKVLARVDSEIMNLTKEISSLRMQRTVILILLILMFILFLLK